VRPIDLPLLAFNKGWDADALTLRSSSCSVVLSIGQPQEVLCWDYLSAMGGLCLSASLNSRRQPADRTYVRNADRDADGHDPNWIWRPRAVPAGLGQAADYSHTFSQIPLMDMPSYVTHFPGKPTRYVSADRPSASPETPSADALPRVNQAYIYPDTPRADLPCRRRYVKPTHSRARKRAYERTYSLRISVSTLPAFHAAFHRYVRSMCRDRITSLHPPIAARHQGAASQRPCVGTAWNW
jgi:hypothetical protein